MLCSDRGKDPSDKETTSVKQVLGTQEGAIQGCPSVPSNILLLFQGKKPAWFSVMASNLLPVHISTLSNADALYEKHAGQELLKVREGAVMGSWL